jgi:hypothetical protein
MRITTAGDVGIGTTGPSAKLHIVGTQTIVQATDASYTLWKDGTPTKAWQYAFASGTNNSVFRHYDGAAWNEYMRIDTSGNVGIGNAPSGTFKLEVTGAVSASTSLTTPIHSGGTAAASTLTLQSTSGAGTSDAIIFKTASQTERMRIVTGGNVGIGTSSPAAPLHVASNNASSYGAYITSAIGTTQVGNGARAALVDFGVGGGLFGNWYYSAGVDRAATTGYSPRIDLYTSDGSIRFLTSTSVATDAAIVWSDRMRLTSAGDLGIGNTPSGTYKLEVTGAVSASTSLTTPLHSGGTAAASTLTLQSTSGAGTSDAIIFKTGSQVEQFRVLTGGGITSAALVDAVGYKGLPQNSQTASYTLALTDMGKMVNTTTGGVVIPANSSVAFPTGSTVIVYNNSASNQTISITTDTIYLAGTATTGSRTLAQRGLATLVKVASTTWVASGAGVT